MAVSPNGRTVATSSSDRSVRLWSPLDKPALLHTLAQNKGIVLTREQLLSLVWGFDFYGQTRTVDVHMAHLRKNISGSSTVTIETITGVGYKLVA